MEPLHLCVSSDFSSERRQWTSSTLSFVKMKKLWRVFACILMMIPNPLEFQVCKGLLFSSLSVRVIFILKSSGQSWRNISFQSAAFWAIILEIYNFSCILPSVFLFPFNWTSIYHLLKIRKSHLFFSFSLHFLLQYDIYHSPFFSPSYSTFLFILLQAILQMPSSSCWYSPLEPLFLFWSLFRIYNTIPACLPSFSFVYSCPFPFLVKIILPIPLAILPFSGILWQLFVFFSIKFKIVFAPSQSLCHCYLV